jgi:hypothetical protein
MSVHLTEHNMAGVTCRDDATLGAWRLTAILRVPEFMNVAALFLYGNERIVVRGSSRKELESWAALNGIPTHSRLISLTIEEAP